MKNDVGQIRLLLELSELLFDYSVVAGTTIGLRKHQVMILVGMIRHLELFLTLLPVAQNIGDGFRNPDFADAAIGFRFFKHKNSRGRLFQCGIKDVQDRVLSESLDGFAPRTIHFFIDIEPCVILCDIIRLDMHVVPRQPQNFAQTHGTGERQVHGDIELCVTAGFKRFADGCRIPDIPMMVRGFDKNSI